MMHPMKALAVLIGLVVVGLVVIALLLPYVSPALHGGLGVAVGVVCAAVWQWIIYR
jgi:hypothetical protein